MFDSLSSIEAALDRLSRHELLDRLLPGRRNDDIVAALAAQGMPASSELVDWYRWHDGTNLWGTRLDGEPVTVGDLHLVPGFYFPPLQHALADARAFASDERWGRGWLPLLANGGGDFYVVDGEGAVRRFRLEEIEAPVEFRSVDAFTETVAQAYARGVFFVSVDGYLEMDADRFASLALEMNSDVPWWSDPL